MHFSLSHTNLSWILPGVSDVFSLHEQKVPKLTRCHKRLCMHCCSSWIWMIKESWTLFRDTRKEILTDILIITVGKNTCKNIGKTLFHFRLLFKCYQRERLKDCLLEKRTERIISRELRESRIVVDLILDLPSVSLFISVGINAYSQRSETSFSSITLSHFPWLSRQRQRWWWWWWA